MSLEIHPRVGPGGETEIHFNPKLSGMKVDFAVSHDSAPSPPPPRRHARMSTTRTPSPPPPLDDDDEEEKKEEKKETPPARPAVREWSYVDDPVHKEYMKQAMHTAGIHSAIARKIAMIGARAGL